MTETATNFTGHPNRECGAHRTTGPHRAWCFDCSEWCAPHAPCVRCEVPRLRALPTVDDVYQHIDPDMAHWMTRGQIKAVIDGIKAWRERV